LHKIPRNFTLRLYLKNTDSIELNAQNVTLTIGDIMINRIIAVIHCVSANTLLLVTAQEKEEKDKKFNIMKLMIVSKKFSVQEKIHVSPLTDTLLLPDGGMMSTMWQLEFSATNLFV